MLKGKLFLLLMFVFVLSFFGGCKLFSGDGDFMPEAAVPKDAKVVAVIDHTNDNQIDQVEELIKRFPWQKETFKDLDQKLDDSVKGRFGEDVTWKGNLKPLLRSKWKAAFWGDELLQVRSMSEVNSMNAAIQLEDPDELEKLISKIAKKQNSEEESNKDMQIWETTDGSNLIIVRYNDLFWISDEKPETVQERIDNKNGFNTNEAILNQVKAMKEENLGYAYIAKWSNASLDEEADSELYSLEFSQVGNRLAEAMGESISVYFADNEGIRALEKTLVLDAEVPEFKSLKNYNLFLADRIPAEGLVIYAEMDNFGSIFDVISVGIEDGRSEFAKTLSVKKADLDALFDSPFAVALYDTKIPIPAGTIYFDIEEKDRDAAKRLSENMDKFADATLVEFNKEIEQDSGGKNSMKREVIPVNGEALRKVSLDWSLIPVEKQLQYGAMMGANINDVLVNFYYGMIDEKTFVVGLYPALEKKYGKDVVKNSEVYKQTAAGHSLNTYGYIGMSDFLGFFSKYLSRVMALMAGEGQEQLIVVEDIISAIRTVKYMAVGAYMSEDGKYLISDTLVKIERLPDEKVKR